MGDPQGVDMVLPYKDRIPQIKLNHRWKPYGSKGIDVKQNNMKDEDIGHKKESNIISESESHEKKRKHKHKKEKKHKKTKIKREHSGKKLKVKRENSVEEKPEHLKIESEDQQI